MQGTCLPSFSPELGGGKGKKKTEAEPKRGRGGRQEINRPHLARPALPGLGQCLRVSPQEKSVRGALAALTLLISPLKTTSSAFNCSTFIASSSWQASASWASYSQAENPDISGSASVRGRQDKEGQGAGSRAER